MTPSQPKLVIFDCDGVLVDSEPIAARVLADCLTEAGWRIAPDEVDALFLGGVMQNIVDAAKNRIPDLAEDFSDQIYARLFEALQFAPKIDGIDEILDALDAANIPYAVGSNGPHAKMDVTLGATGLKPRFDGRIFSARDVARPKPAPDVFLRAAEALGVEASACFVVGDSRNDALAAQAAEMRFCGLAGHTPSAVFDALGADCAPSLDAIAVRIFGAPKNA